MLPQINGKSFLSCTENDLNVLVENADYRENEYIDYKLNFAFLEIEKGPVRDSKKAEFKIDVCAFANADGGYLIFGIGDKNGCASEIKGIDIKNNDTDRFELDRRNDLNGIQPKTPQIQFSFIQLASGKYVVVMYIKHDSFAPYVYLEDEKNYKIYSRYGNGKRIMTYSELRQMFNQSLSLDQAVLSYIHQRIDYYRSLGDSFGNSFVHLCFIPETFMDTSYRQNMFILERLGKYNFSSIFSAFRCDTSSIPCVDGVRYIPYSDEFEHAEGYVRNNGIVEACMSLDGVLKTSDKYPDGFLPWGWLLDKHKSFVYQYSQVFRQINTGERVFLCLSIVGCRNVVTNDQGFQYDYTGKIDRDEVICDPIEILRIDNDDEISFTLKKLQIAFLLAIGVKYDDSLKKLIDEVYGAK